MLGEVKSLATHLLVHESVILGAVEEDAVFDRVHNPVALEDISPEVLHFLYVLGDGRHLICEALLEVAHEAAMLLNQDAHVVPVAARRQVEHHRHSTDDGQRLSKDWWLCAHFFFFSLF